MIDKIKNNMVVMSFFIVLLGFCITHFVLADTPFSYSERRALNSNPGITVENLFSGDFMEEFEQYLLDQFPFRDSFRKLKAHISFDLFKKKENNGIYIVDDGVYKLEYPLKEKQVLLGAQKLNTLYDTYLSGMNVYYAIIPDKNYFVAEQNGYLALDYNRMDELLSGNIQNIQKIELADCLTLEDYYRTDPHWRQDKLDRVVARLAESLSLSLPTLDMYTTKTFSPFYGAYCGQSALTVLPDEIVYLNSKTTDHASLYNFEKDSISSVYTPEVYNGMDAYDLFMGGASAFIELENRNNTSGRELVVFRDSFASSLAPLLTEGYSKITLIDIRYMSSQLLPQLITFEKQDVLFLYSTLVFNNSAMLR